MKDNTYLIPKNGTCPICHSQLIYTNSRRFANCNDCESVFKVSDETCKYGGDHDLLLVHLNSNKEAGHGTETK